MTRPKVPADKRIRTAQACETCKRRKQKCNGHLPCSTCTKRNLECEYVPNSASGNSGSGNGNGREVDDAAAVSATKRRLIDHDVSTRLPKAAPLAPVSQPPVLSLPASMDSSPRRHGVIEKSRVSFEARLSVASEGELDVPDQDYELFSKNSTVSGPDEETQLLQSTRMLQDPTGRLLYVGDSASLAYLQLIRIIVQARTGINNFTEDPNRHKILEATTETLPHFKPQILPDKETASCLIDAFFTHTHGLVEVVNRRSFELLVEACYAKPLHAQSSFLCLLYLIFAIGTVMGTPAPGTREEYVFNELRSQPGREEYFFRTAKFLGDPVSGFEDADFWSVQALSLMAIYMLAVSKRNAAYAYFGMAVRTAFALGLHRVHENHSIFSSDDVKLRRNLWRSLFVLDRFLAASLGRPAAIAEDECSEHALLVFEKDEDGDLVKIPDPGSGLGAAVEGCRIIGKILKKIYARRRISLGLAKEISGLCETWTSQLPPSLDLFRMPIEPYDVSASVAALHVGLLYAHSVVLLTRPFFICLLSKVHNERSGHKLRDPRWHNRMSKYCEACFLASNHTIHLVHRAFEGRYLPRRNPFVTYFLFAACLIILSNEFGSVYANPTYASSMQASMDIVRYCAETDIQAGRLLYILRTFCDAVASVRSTGDPAAHQMPGTSMKQPMTAFFSPPSRKASFAYSSSTRASTARASISAPCTIPVGAGPMYTGVGTSPTSSGAVSSGGVDGADSLGGHDGELDFESFWGNISRGPAPLIVTSTPTGTMQPLHQTSPTLLPSVPMKNGVAMGYAHSRPNGVGGHHHGSVAGQSFFAPGQFSQQEQPIFPPGGEG